MSETRCVATIAAVQEETKNMNSFESAMHAWNKFADLAHALERENAALREAIAHACECEADAAKYAMEQGAYRHAATIARTLVFHGNPPPSDSGGSEVEELRAQVESWERWARSFSRADNRTMGMIQAAMEGNLRALQLATVRLLREVQPHHIPGTAYEMAQQAIAAFPDVTCSDCHGSGTRLVGDHARGPDGDTYEVECAGCFGVGTVPPSAEVHTNFPSQENAR